MAAIIADVAGAINAARLEMLAARAWPALEAVRMDGWLLRRMPSVGRRRLNSALPVGDGAAVEEVERFYRAHGMTPLVQVAPAEGLHALDAELEARGWNAHVLRRIPSPAGFAIARVEGRPAGVGIAVCEGGWSGVFCMATDPAMRRRGVARAVLSALAEWSRAQRAHGLYLQVECDNAPAQALYASLGFTRSHGYHFRAGP